MSSPSAAAALPTNTDTEIEEVEVDENDSVPELQKLEKPDNTGNDNKTRVPGIRIHNNDGNNQGEVVLYNLPSSLPGRMMVCTVTLLDNVDARAAMDTRIPAMVPNKETAEGVKKWLRFMCESQVEFVDADPQVPLWSNVFSVEEGKMLLTLQTMQSSNRTLPCFAYAGLTGGNAHRLDMATTLQVTLKPKFVLDVSAKRFIVDLVVHDMVVLAQ